MEHFEFGHGQEGKGREHLIYKKGSYSGGELGDHMRLFDGLRTLALQRYRSNITRSLLGHLHLEHSNERRLPKTVSWVDINDGKITSKRVMISAWVSLNI